MKIPSKKDEPVKFDDPLWLKEIKKELAVMRTEVAALTEAVLALAESPKAPKTK